MVACSLDLRTRVLKDSDAGMASKLVAEKDAVSRAWIDRLKQRRRETGEIAPRRQTRWRTPLLHAQLPRLAILIREQPDRTLVELQQALPTSASLPTIWDWVGGRVTPPVRPHHRAYGSVHGGSSAPLQIPELSQQVQEFPHRKQAIVHGRMHVRGPRVPPGAAPGGGGLARTRSLEAQCDHFATPSLRFLPLLPQDFAEAPAKPLIQFVERVCHCGQATVANPSSGEPIHLVDHRTDVSSPSRVRDVADPILGACERRRSGFHSGGEMGRDRAA